MELTKIRSLSDEELKTDIARIKTIARERTLSAEREANPVVKNVAPAKSTRTARKNAKKG